MPVHALISRGNATTPEVLVAAAFLVYAIEHCISPTTLGSLDERLAHLASASALDDQVCLILIQDSLDRPLSGIDPASSARLDKLETRFIELFNGCNDQIQRQIRILAQIDSRRRRLSADDGDEPISFEHLSDDQIQKIEEAAYQGILRFPPARQFPSLTPLVVKAVHDVARWDSRNSDSNDKAEQRLAKLCSIARNVGKQRAIDTWRTKAESATPNASTEAVFYDCALCSLMKLARIERIDHRALLLAELAFGPRERGKDPPYRQWFGISPGNFRISLMRARQSFSERLQDATPLEKPITVERTLEALAPAALLLAQRAIKAQTDFWTNDTNNPPSNPSPHNDDDLQRSEDAMAPNDPRFDNISALELLLRCAYSSKAPLPHALVLAASANMLDEQATVFIEKVDYHRVNGLRSAMHRNELSLIERENSIGSVVVRLLKEFKNWEVHWTGFAVKPAIALGPTTSSSELSAYVPIRLFFDDEHKEWLEFKIMPSRSITTSVDIAIETPPASIAMITILSTHGDASSRWLVNVDELRNELCSRVLRDVFPGEYRIVGVDKDKKEYGWNLALVDEMSDHELSREA